MSALTSLGKAAKRILESPGETAEQMHKVRKGEDVGQSEEALREAEGMPVEKGEPEKLSEDEMTAMVDATKTKAPKSEGYIRRKSKEMADFTLRDTGADELAEVNLEGAAPAAGRTPQRNINTAYVEAFDETKRLLDDVAENAGGFTKQRRGVRSHETTTRAASQIDTEQMIKLIGGKPGQAWNAEQLLRGRDIMVSLGDNIVELSQMVKSGSATDLQKAELIQSHKALVTVQRAMQGAIAEAGRALNSMQIVSGGNKRAYENMQQILMEHGSGGSVTALAEIYGKYTKAELRAGKLADMAEESRKMEGLGTRLTRVAAEYWINSILSGVKTHVVNLTGTGLANVYDKALVKPTAISIGKARESVAKLTGKKVEPAMYWAEIPMDGLGALNGLSDTLVAMYQDVTKRTSLTQKLPGAGSADTYDYFRNLGASQKFENPEMRALSAEGLGLRKDTATGKGVDIAGSVLRTPTGVLATEDDIMKAMIYRGSLNTQAYRFAQDALKAGEIAPEQVNPLVAKLLDNPTQDMHDLALNEAERLTFTEQQVKKAAEGSDQSGSARAVAKVAVGLTSFINNQMPAMTFLVPFVQTPTNLVQYTFQNMPTLALTKKFRSDIAAGGRRADMAAARLTVGTGISLTVAHNVNQGLITGNGPKDYNMRKVMIEGGWQENSIKIGDVWYRYDRADPIGMQIGLIADSMDAVRYTKEDNKDVVGFSTSVMATSAMVFSEKSYMQGLGALVSVMNARDNDEAERMLKSHVGSIASGFIPFSAFVRGVRQADDEYTRMVVDDQKTYGAWVSTLQNKALNTVPGFSDSLPAEVDWKGEFVPYKGGAYARMMSPIEISAAVGDESSMLLAAANVNPVPPMPTVTVKSATAGQPGYSLNLNQIDPSLHLYQKYRIFVGKGRKRRVDEAVARIKQKGLTVEQNSIAANLLTQAVAKGAEDGKMAFLKYYRDNRDANWIELTSESIKEAARELEAYRKETGKIQRKSQLIETKPPLGPAVPKEIQEAPRF